MTNNTAPFLRAYAIIPSQSRIDVIHRAARINYIYSISVRPLMLNIQNKIVVTFPALILF